MHATQEAGKLKIDTQFNNLQNMFQTRRKETTSKVTTI